MADSPRKSTMAVHIDRDIEALRKTTLAYGTDIVVSTIYTDF
jgi:hypothetical protein